MICIYLYAREGHKYGRRLASDVTLKPSIDLPVHRWSLNASGHGLVQVSSTFWSKLPSISISYTYRRMVISRPVEFVSF